MKNEVTDEVARVQMAKMLTVYSSKTTADKMLQFIERDR